MKRLALASHVSAFVFLFNSNFNCFPFFFFTPCVLNCTVPGGLTLREGTRIIDRVFESGRLCGLDIVEVGPNVGDAKDLKTTVNSAVQLIAAAMGNRRSGNLPSTHTDLPRN